MLGVCIQYQRAYNLEIIYIKPLVNICNFYNCVKKKKEKLMQRLLSDAHKPSNALCTLKTLNTTMI